MFFFCSGRRFLIFISGMVEQVGRRDENTQPLIEEKWTGPLADH